MAKTADLENQSRFQGGMQSEVISGGRQIRGGLLALSKRQKLLLELFVDTVTLAICAVVAGIVGIASSPGTAVFAGYVAVAVAISMAALGLTGSYRMVVRFIGVDFFARALIAMLGTAIALIGLRQLLGIPGIHFNTPIQYGATGFIAILSIRYLAQELLRSRAAVGSVRGTKVLIYGAGQAGMQLATALQSHQRFEIAGFVDDAPGLQGRFILGVRVYERRQIAELKQSAGISLILLAMPSLNRAAQRQLLEQLEPLALKVLVIPGLHDLASGSKRVDELRQVQIEDLLQRDAIAPIPGLQDRCIAGKSVLVTGGGGSIGSELARQVLLLGAKRLVLLDASEFALYEIQRELLQSDFEHQCEIIPVLGSVLDGALVTRTLTQHHIETVYHAAAYKHVPLVEDNVISALRNNVFGTLNTLQASIAAQVKHFVLISTDKAVRPTNVMGASKRCCELLVQALAPLNPQMQMSMVRFGNVLASSGSVIPLFMEQIKKGGPVTVTHPEITRYFMTIPEAAQLVVQAGSMGRNGEVFVLDMGEPVKINLLAERMIRLSGLLPRTPQNANGDIEIQYTGLRPGEKLFEELLIGDSPEATQHPRIFKANEAKLDWQDLSIWMEQLRLSLDAECPVRARKQLAEVVSGYAAPDTRLTKVAPIPLAMAG